MVKTPELEAPDFSAEHNKRAKLKHPAGLYLLYFTEMWERFSYYGMRAIFTLYMVNALLYDKAMASSIYGSYTGLVYLTPLLGGYIADRYWGNRKSIIFGGILMAAGQFLMFTSGSLYTTPETAKIIMYSGLGFLIFGNGFFKPNISTMVGQLYKPGDSRVDSAFTIFYQGINLGALLAPLVCGSLGEVYDEAGNIVPSMFRWGFLAAGIGMVLSLVAFIVYKNKYIVTPEGEPVGLPPAEQQQNSINQESPVNVPSSGFNFKKIIFALVGFGILFYVFKVHVDQDLIGAFIFSACIILPAVIITDPSLTAIEKSRIWVIYIVAFFVIFFWSAFEQAGASLTFFAQEQTDREIFGWNMPASLFQMFNALFIVVLAPVAVAIWSFLAARNREPASPVKQSLGLGFLALGYLFIAYGVDGVQPWDKVSMMWLVGLYLIHTIGELCLSPIGLSMVVKLAPARFVSLLMGVWFMSTATANKFAGELSALYPEEVKIENSYRAPAEDIQTVNNLIIDDEVWKMSPKEIVSLPVASYDKEKRQMSNVELTGETKEVSVYNLKLIRTANGKFSTAAVSADGRYLISNRENNIDIWNLQPDKPSFLGMKISTMYDFFMIFVYMSGAAAVLLFLISRPLLKMMHGIR
jgi:proton-dependent oligopeptide transporter, POT family